MTTSTRCSSNCGMVLVSTVPSAAVGGTRWPSKRISVRMMPTPRRFRKLPVEFWLALPSVCWPREPLNTGSLFSASGTFEGVVTASSSVVTTVTGVDRLSPLVMTRDPVITTSSRTLCGTATQTPAASDRDRRRRSPDSRRRPDSWESSGCCPGRLPRDPAQRWTLSTTTSQDVADVRVCRCLEFLHDHAFRRRFHLQDRLPVAAGVARRFLITLQTHRLLARRPRSENDDGAGVDELESQASPGQQSSQAPARPCNDPFRAGHCSPSTSPEENRICSPDCWASSFSASPRGSDGMLRLYCPESLKDWAGTVVQTTSAPIMHTNTVRIRIPPP